MARARDTKNIKILVHLEVAEIALYNAMVIFVGNITKCFELKFFIKRQIDIDVRS
jgi:hypothetical protein